MNFDDLKINDDIKSAINKMGFSKLTPIQTKAISRTLEAAQKRIEGFNFDSRKNVVQYDNVINRHRRVVYLMRRKILEGENIEDEINIREDNNIKDSGRNSLDKK